MSTSSLAVNSAAGAPITISGLASGLNTSSIIAALMASEREPVTHLTDEQAKLQAEQTELQSIQSALQQLAFVASEFSLPSLFESSQTVTSNEPTRVSAVATAGAGVGGYEVEVTQLANSAQRTFTFTSPTSEETITIEGHEFKVQAGESAQALASAIDSSSSATVYAAVLEGGAIVLSNRATGNTGGEFIKVTDPGGALTEEVGTAREGKDAEFKVDGVAGTSSSNTVTDAIAGVTLTLGGLTPAGPVTIDVQAPGPSVSAVEAQVQSFVKLYNATVEAIQTQLDTKPVAKVHSTSEYSTGILFGDVELTSLLDSMREVMYEPISGLPAGMSSPFDIGVSTGAPTGSGTSSQASLEGLLTLDPSKLSEAVETNPAGAQQMLEQWSQNLQSLVNDAGAPGGALEARANGDGAQITQLGSQISAMNEMLDHREKALQATYAELESVISRNTTQSDWLTQQEESLSKSGV
jgi:flagellar hook-associated protein 2